MTDAQEQVLIELVERGPLTWFRLDALLGAAGFQLGPALFAEIDRLRDSGMLVVVDVPNGPKRYQIAASYELQAARIAQSARQHRAWLHGSSPTSVAEDWEWVVVDQVPCRDISDVARGPRTSP